jgi:predicted transcriptional regulator of viral defense system
MKMEQLNDYLRGHKIEVFSVYDAAKFISKPAAYTSKFLSRDRYVRRAERGIYYTKDATEYGVASRIVFPSYATLVSSLRFYNLTEQIPHIIYIASPVQHRPITDLNGFEVNFKKIKKPLMYGYRKVDGAFVADPEKAVIDMIYLNEFVEYAEEAVEERNLSTAKLQNYAERSGVKSIIKRVGEMLDDEQRRN